MKLFHGKNLKTHSHFNTKIIERSLCSRESTNFCPYPDDTPQQQIDLHFPTQDNYCISPPCTTNSSTRAFDVIKRCAPLIIAFLVIYGLSRIIKIFNGPGGLKGYLMRMTLDLALRKENHTNNETKHENVVATTSEDLNPEKIIDISNLKSQEVKYTNIDNPINNLDNPSSQTNYRKTTSSTPIKNVARPLCATNTLYLSSLHTLIEDSNNTKVITSCLPKHLRTKNYLNLVLLSHSEKINSTLKTFIPNKQKQIAKNLTQFKPEIQPQYFENSREKKVMVTIKLLSDHSLVTLLSNPSIYTILLAANNEPKYLSKHFKNQTVSNLLVNLQNKINKNI